MDTLNFNDYFDYKEGNLYWKVKPSLVVNIGDKAGTLNSGGYLQVKLKNKKRLVHHVVYAMHHGFIPKEIDHINRIRSDNRIENLRPVTRGQNLLNINLLKRNKSGYKNICWHKASQKWIVQGRKDGKPLYLGVYANLEDAKKVASELHVMYDETLNQRRF
jgi:hypothetical protein